jgi:CheY-like chemotaxis protein
MNKKTNFPVVPLSDAPPPEADTMDQARRPMVLVVDDESVIADTLSAILVKSGYAAVAAYDSEEAIETALLMPPDLLISDVVLPGMSGVDLAITIKRIFPDCRIILFSGQASTANLISEAATAGHHFLLLNKPVHPKDLLAQVAMNLADRRPAPAVAYA